MLGQIMYQLLSDLLQVKLGSQVNGRAPQMSLQLAALTQFHLQATTHPFFVLMSTFARMDSSSSWDSRLAAQGCNHKDKVQP